ncbi:MAG: choice-of-anchor I family protein [Myxococcota bacterium]
MTVGINFTSRATLAALACLALACADDTTASGDGSSGIGGGTTSGLATTTGDAPPPATTRDDAENTSGEPGGDSSTGGATGFTTGGTAGGTTGGETGDTEGTDSTDSTGEEPPMELEINRIGRYAPEPLAEIYDEGAAEIAAFDPISQSLFVTNGNDQVIDILDVSDPTMPAFVQALTPSNPDLAGPTSVTVHDGVVAASFPNVDDFAPGEVVFFDSDGTELSSITVGVLPDMVTFTPDGSAVVVANEGEPEGYEPGQVDPEGSVSIIDLARGADNLDDGDVLTAGFQALTPAHIDGSTRIFGPGSSIAQDLEPEYVAVSADSNTAWVTLQENNAMAVVDLNGGLVTQVVGLGFVDHSVTGIDPSDRDDAINIGPVPVWGMRQPDAIASFEAAGATYLITANEGDARDYDGFEEEVRVEDLTLDPTAFPNAADLQLEEALGRLEVTTVNGDADGNGEYEQLFSYGSRSITVFDATGNVVWDSGDAIEQAVAVAFPDDFNSTNDENGSFDSRSDAKGPEPEGLVVGEAFGHAYVFVGLERVGGFMVWDLADPSAPEWLMYINRRDFMGDAEAGTADDLAPEGLVFIGEEDSPTGTPLVVVTNEVSGTVSFYELGLVPVER